jgi:transforming growth factor-beta-induced protein
MKTKKFLSLMLVALSGLFFLSSCSDEETVDGQPGVSGATQSVVEIATTNNDFTTLVEALMKADLVSALEGEGPYTVFAPTNDAFNQLFADLGVDGIDDLSAEALRPILLNHVIAANAPSYAINTGYKSSLNTFTPDKLGTNLYLAAEDMGNLSRGQDAETGEISMKVSKQVRVNGKTDVVIGDVMATNGVIHIVEEVILPASIVDFALADPNFSILVEAVVKADLVSALSAEGPFTVFAPTNQAFEALFAALNVNGIEDLSADDLKPILLYHVVGDNVIAAEVGKGTVGTLNESSSIELDIVGTEVTIDGRARVIATDVQGSNGVIHVIDSVLLP